jgi:hypothetical protein
MDIKKGPSYSRSESIEDFLLEGELNSHSRSCRTSANKMNQHDNIIYSQVFLPPKEYMKASENYSSTKSIMKDSSADNRAVMAVNLEWSPQD